MSRKLSEIRNKEMRDQLVIPLFRAKEQNHWDAGPKRIVVIGSGIGGMASGALFARAGHKVCVLELEREIIGGHARCLTFGGMKYSMGPQYVWEFGDRMIGDRFLKFLGMKDSNPFVPMAADGFERLFIGDRSFKDNYYFVDFKVPLGLQNFRRELVALFPEESGKLNSLFDDMISIFETYKTFFKVHSTTEGRLLLATKFLLAGKVPMSLKIKLGRTVSQTLKEFFDQYQINPIIRRILYGHGGIFAESESEMSAIAYIVGTGNYHRGAWYPQNGFHHLFVSLASIIKEAGGSVETGKRVSQIVANENIVEKVICEDGTTYDCDFLFSDISPRLTCALLGRDAKFLEYVPSHSIAACCIGVKGGLPKISAMRGRNYWWQDGREVNYQNPDITTPPQMLFIGSSTANGFGKDEGCADDALIVFCPGNYQQEKEFYKLGPDSVKLFKQKLARSILAILDRNIFPGIKSRVSFTEIVSSVDVENDIGSELGNAYGRRLTVAEILKGPIAEEDCPANLYNVSATKNSPGIAAGVFTASLLFEELTGKKI